MSTGLYDPAVADLVKSGFRNLWSVDVLNVTDNVPVKLDTTECELTMDENWSPYVQGTVRAVIPSSQSQLDALDPRKVVRITINAGYVLPNGTADMKPLAVTYLTRRDVRRPGDTIELSVQGSEYLRDTWAPLFLGDGWARGEMGTTYAQWTQTTPARVAITRCLLACGAIKGNDIPVWDYTDPTWAYDEAMQTDEWVDPGTVWTPGEADNESPLGVARDVAWRVNGWFRCDELGTWRLTPRPALAGTTSHNLEVGAAGTIVDSNTGLSRDGWFNAVKVTYRWVGGHEASGWAETNSGPYATAVVGRVPMITEYPWRGGPIGAGTKAKNLLAKNLSFGRTMTLGATAAYWLRPAHTVAVQLPLGPQERHLVSAISYRLHEGSMSVTTRVPDPS